jgi:hypothetical protein
MSHPAPDPFRVAARSRGVQVEVDLTVDRNRDSTGSPATSSTPSTAS